MIMDIDHFKKVNDTWGHPVGDQVIKTVVSIIGKSIRPDDLFARVGGEEFGVLLTDIDTERAKALAERIRENVERLTGDNPEYAIPQKVTISIGAVVTQKNELNPKEIYQLADNALYEAKETGRNKVVVKEAEILINRKDDEWVCRQLSNPDRGFSSPRCVQYTKKKPVLSYELFFKYGGEGGIRTPDTLPYTHFPGVLLQPLGHLTKLSFLSCWNGR